GNRDYQIKVNITAPTLTYRRIEEPDPYSIVDKPTTGMIYLNSKDEKWVMYLMEIVRFCDATLEKVLKEAKLKIFQSEPWKKPPLLGVTKIVLLSIECRRDYYKSHMKKLSRDFLKLDETMDECTRDILRKRDFFDRFREVSWVIPTFVVIEGENLDLEPKIDAMMRDFLESPSRRKELSKETGSKILPSGDGSF
nr:hypothetical protein [Tanacetum cinerariifolium]